MVFALFVLSTVMVALFIRSYRPLSPIDELQHLDYAYKVSQGHLLVRTGERVGFDAMRDEACHGIDFPTFFPPACGASAYDPAQFQERGYNTADIHAPLYYIPAAVMGTVVRAIHPTGFLVGARLAGILWLVAGLYLTWRIAGELGAGRLVTGAMVVLTAVTPQVLFDASTVTNDGAEMVAGGLLVLAMLHWLRGRWRLWTLLAAAALAPLLKAPDLVAVFAVAVALTTLALAAWRADRPLAWRRLRAAVLVGVAGLASEGAFVTVRHVMALVSQTDVPMTRAAHVPSIPLHQLIHTATTLVTPISAPYLDQAFNGDWVQTEVALLGMALMGGVFGVALLSRHLDDVSALAAGTVVALLSGGPIVTLGTFLAQTTYAPPPPRYGLSVLPAMVALTAVAARNPPARIAMSGLAGLTLLTEMVILVRIAA